jgi:hypothetical protein
MQRVRAALHPDLEWLCGLLWEASDDVTARAGQDIPLGFTRVRSYAILPDAARPRFLVPLDSRRAGAASLHRYNALRPTARRLARDVAAGAARSGALRLRGGSRLDVSVRSSVRGERLAELVLEEHLSALAGRPVHAGIGVGHADPHRKPVLQAFDAGGRPVGYVKVAWNEVSRGLVRAEAEALRTVAARPRGFSAPRLLHHGQWRDLELSVAAPLPQDVRRYRSPGPPPPSVTGEVAALTGTSTGMLRESAYWIRLRQRLASASGPEVAALVRLVEDTPGERPLEFGGWHGDWVPWNLAVLGNRLHVWDWEHSGPGVPLGFDVIHFAFQVLFVREGRPVAEAARACREAAVTSLRAFGLHRREAGLVVTLYLLEMLARDRDAVRAGAEPNHRLYPGILGALAEAAREG